MQNLIICAEVQLLFVIRHTYNKPLNYNKVNLASKLDIANVEIPFIALDIEYFLILLSDW